MFLFFIVVNMLVISSKPIIYINSIIKYLKIKKNKCTYLYRTTEVISETIQHQSKTEKRKNENVTIKVYKITGFFRKKIIYYYYYLCI